MLPVDERTEERRVNGGVGRDADAVVGNDPVRGSRFFLVKA
jgi:hypothetical protein